MKLEGSFSRRTGWACVRKYLFVGARRDLEWLTAKSAGFGCALPAGLSSDAARDVGGANFIVRARCRYQMGGGGRGNGEVARGTQQREGAQECKEPSDEEWRHAG